MSRRKNFILILILCLIIFAGCTKAETSSKADIQPLESVPEPYEKMIQNMELNDLDMCERYADLVIKDFADSDYVYNAYLIKNIIISSKLSLNGYKIGFLGDGVDKMGAMSSESDLTKVKEYFEGLKNNLDNFEKDYCLTAEYLLNNYQMSELIKLEFPKAPTDLNIIGENDLQGLVWFAQIGYPIPTESEMNGNDKENELKLFYEYSNGFSQEKNFSYIEYFYRISNFSSNNDLDKRLLNKVIEFTEDDQYNEFRIQAQDQLNKQL